VAAPWSSSRLSTMRRVLSVHGGAAGRSAPSGDRGRCCRQPARARFCWNAVFRSVACVSRGGPAGSRGDSMFSFLRNHPAVPPGDSRSHIPTSTAQGLGFLRFLTGFVICFLVLAILVDGRWCPSVVLICISLKPRDSGHLGTCVALSLEEPDFSRISLFQNSIREVSPGGQTAALRGF